MRKLVGMLLKVRGLIGVELMVMEACQNVAKTDTT